MNVSRKTDLIENLRFLKYLQNNNKHNNTQMKVEHKLSYFYFARNNAL